jgi:hypothetical protein
MATPALIPYQLPGVLAGLVDSVRRYATASRAESTLRGYRSDWADFQRFCRLHWLDSLPLLPQLRPTSQHVLTAAN